MRIKKIGISRDYSSYEEVKEQHVVAQGWREYGDLSFLCDPHENLRDHIDRISGWTQGGRNAFNQLFRDIKAGDIVLAFEGNSLKGICEVPKEHVYFFNEEVEDYRNSIFPVEWVDWNDFCQGSQYIDFMQGGQGVPGIQNFYTPDDLRKYISDHWPQYKAKTGLKVQPTECQEKLDKLKAELPQRIIDTKILYMEKLKEKAMGEYISRFVKLLKSNHNLILHGAPGTGKTHTAIEIAKAMDAEWCKVQFHPSYDYSDFVEGLRPVRSDNGQIGFARKNGIFMSFCEKALKSKERDFVFIIDEINRGDISKIFGELFSCIEAGYRGPKGHVFTQYSNLVETPTVFDEIVDKGGSEYGNFFVPSNVYIIGTMNDIDRSVESMDFAMRRRFTFEEITAQDSALAMGLTDEQMEYMNRLNAAIVSDEIGLDESFQIGGSYFINVTDFDALWRRKLRGLLKEYLRGSDNIADKLELLENAFYGKN